MKVLIAILIFLLLIAAMVLVLPLVVALMLASVPTLPFIGQDLPLMWASSVL